MENALLTSGQTYYVYINGKSEKIINLNESEYKDFYQRIQKEDRYVKIKGIFYFWSDIKEFGPNIMVNREGGTDYSKL